MDLGLKGKRALVIGGGRGLGRGVAQALSEEGAQVAIASRDIAALQQASAEISRKTGGTVLACQLDTGDGASIERAVNTIADALGGIDVLLNNSGGPPPTGAAGVPLTVWRQQFESLVLGVIQITDLVLPAMKAAGWGRIATIASTTVIEPNPLLGLSNALRSTLVGWSKTLAGEVALHGITVNLLLPGRISTDRMLQIDSEGARNRGLDIESVRSAAASRIPVGRYGTPEEFGKVAAFICSTAASYVTGSMIRVDGGAVASV